MLFVASEVAPFAKTGGLADVAAALPRALARRGHEVRVVMPGYDSIGAGGHEPIPGEPDMLGFDLGPNRIAADIEQLDLDGVAVTLVDVPSLYRRGSLYTEDPDENLRFAVLGKAALELCRRWGWSPNVVHCNDWQTGLIPLQLRTTYRDDPVLEGARSVFTIHNLAYQGVFDAATIDSLGLAEHRHLFREGSLEKGRLGFLETGLVHADVITTVSSTYAREILTPEYGCGLDDLLRERSGVLFGILNGIDTDVWNPTTDLHLAHRYSKKSLWRKEWNKRDLLEGLGLEYLERTPVFGLVSRLVSQKGIDLIPRPMAGVLEATDARFVALGSGEPEVESGLGWLVDRFPGQARFVSGYDETLSHRIEASIDGFLMPSRYEPSGLNQMYSLAYGTPPLVRRTGGLADTVEHWDPDTALGTGFLFEHADEGGVRWALEEALSAWGDRSGWRNLQRNGMAVDNSWDRSAGAYEDLYLTLGEVDS